MLRASLLWRLLTACSSRCSSGRIGDGLSEGRSSPDGATCGPEAALQSLSSGGSLSVQEMVRPLFHITVTDMLNAYQDEPLSVTTATTEHSLAAHGADALNMDHAAPNHSPH